MRTACVLLLAAIAAVNCLNQIDDGACLKTYTSTMGITTSLSCRSFCYTKFLHPKCEEENCTCVSEPQRKDIVVRPSSTSRAKTNVNCQKEIRFDGEERAIISCTAFCSARDLQAKCEGDHCKCIARQAVGKNPTLPPLKMPKPSQSYYASSSSFVYEAPMYPFSFEVPLLPSKSEYLKSYTGRYIIL